MGAWVDARSDYTCEMMVYRASGRALKDYGQRREAFRSADFGEIGLRRSISPKSMRA